MAKLFEMAEVDYIARKMKVNSVGRLMGRFRLPNPRKWPMMGDADFFSSCGGGGSGLRVGFGG
jgi:hypothetical protein